MVIRPGITGVDEGDVICMLGDIRQDIGNIGTGLAMPVPLKGGLQAFTAGGEKTGLRIRTGQLGAAAFDELGLVGFKSPSTQVFIFWPMLPLYTPTIWQISRIFAGRNRMLRCIRARDRCGDNSCIRPDSE